MHRHADIQLKVTHCAVYIQAKIIKSTLVNTTKSVIFEAKKISLQFSFAEETRSGCHQIIPPNNTIHSRKLLILTENQRKNAI